MRALRRRRPHRTPTAPPRRGRGEQPALVAAVAAVAVVASLLTAGGVQAAGVAGGVGQRLDLARDPGWVSGAKSPGQLGQAVVSPWTASADGGTASALLPGGVGSISVQGAASDVLVGDRTAQMVGAPGTEIVNMLSRFPDHLNPVSVNCLSEVPGPPSPQPTVGFQKVCGQREVTVTFGRPTVDPVLWLGTRAFRTVPEVGASDPQCSNTWHNTSVVGVDGAPPDAGRLALVSDADSLTGFVDGALSYEVGADPTTCDFILDDPRGYAGVQVTGMVSSVTLRLDHVVMITRVDSSGDFGRGVVAQPEYALTTSADVVDLSVSATAPETVAPGEVFDWTLDVSNLSTTGSHGLVFSGAVPEAVTDAVLVEAPEGCALSGRDLVCSVAPPGWSVSQDPTVSTLANLAGGDPASVGEVLAGAAAYGPVILRGTAPVTPGTEVVTSAAVAGVDSDLDLTNNAAQAVTTVAAPSWTVAKTVAVSGDAAYPAPGDTLSYSVEATSSSGVVEGVTLTDDLTDVLAGADLVPGSVRLTVGDGAAVPLPDPTPSDPVLVAGPVTLAAGETARLTYDVVVHGDGWSAELANTVRATGLGAPATCAVDAPEVDPACSTSSRVTARVEVLKQGQVNGTLQGIDGAAFEVVADDAGSPGALLTSTAVTPVTGRPGTFEIAGIDPGTYWLRETTAPAVHELLPEPVRFEVAADGGVTVLEGGSAQVVASGGTLTVTDAPSFALPDTGSSQRAPLAALGGLLLAGAALALRSLRPRAPHALVPTTQAGRRPGH